MRAVVLFLPLDGEALFLPRGVPLALLVDLPRGVLAPPMGVFASRALRSRPNRRPDDSDMARENVEEENMRGSVGLG